MSQPEARPLLLDGRRAAYTADAQLLPRRRAAAAAPSSAGWLGLYNAAVCLCGIQFMWTVELAYGTPYLLELGLSKPVLSLVWVAGPLSGLLVQPMVGVWSDACRSRLGRRRPYMLGGALVVLVGLFLVARARALAAWLLRAAAIDAASLAIGLAVLGFFLLDFAINAVQASARALILDVAAAQHQSRANALASTMIQLGAVLGYFAGLLDLPALAPELGADSQMEALCIVAAAVFAAGVAWTCLWTRETPWDGDDDPRSTAGAWRPLLAALAAIPRLPPRVAAICSVQLLAWMAWFPFLFYSTTWIMEVLLRTHSPKEPGFPDAAVRTGSLALCLHAVTALLTSLLLPPLAAACNRLFGRFSRAVLATRRIWTWSLLWLGAALCVTWWVADVRDAILVVAACGVSMAVATWAPFAMLGVECAAMVRRQRSTPPDGDDDAGSPVVSETASMEAGIGVAPSLPPSLPPLSRPTAALDTGVVLGIHNIFVVAPQFISILLSSLIFWYIGDAPPELGPAAPGPSAHESVGWVLRTGGVFALLAALLSVRCW